MGVMVRQSVPCVVAVLSGAGNLAAGRASSGWASTPCRPSLHCYDFGSTEQLGTTQDGLHIRPRWCSNWLHPTRAEFAFGTVLWRVAMKLTRLPRRYIHLGFSTLIVLAILSGSPPEAEAAFDATVQDLTPTEVVQLVQEKTYVEISNWVSSQSANDRKLFFGILKTTIDSGFKYSDVQLKTIEQIISLYDIDGVMIETLLDRHPCHSGDALELEPKCRTRRDGAAYGSYSRRMFKNAACWRTLELARSMDKAFLEGIREYYARQANAADGGLSLCDKPNPPRCQLAKCSIFLDKGIAVRPLTDLGIAIPLWHPKFGFKAGESATLQATAGLLVRGFVFDGKLDLRVGAGIANAVGSDGTSSTAALAWTVQLGVFEMLGVGFLGLTDPSDFTTGKAISFSIDLVGVRDLVGDLSKKK